MTTANAQDDVVLFQHLLKFVQMPGEQADEAAERLCWEIASITSSSIQLVLHDQGSSKRTKASASHKRIPIAVESHNLIYGTLLIGGDSLQAGQPALSLSIGQLLAHACGSILYELEVSTLLQKQFQRFGPQNPGRLTKRERDVLKLMCRGYKEEAIACVLKIKPVTVGTHRRRVYEKLGVHCEHSVVVAAYQAKLFLPLESV